MTAVRRVAIVTGSRAEFGLLRPVIHAVRNHKALRLQVVAAGAHFLPPARTITEVEAEFTVAARVPMQRQAKTGRNADAAATGAGVAGFARAFARLKPDWVVVLGDRIEAFAAASAASIGGIAVCHIHGGDRAEGIADEAMRHAITKLSHLHCAATKASAERIVRMGEDPRRVVATGSPAIDGLSAIKAMGDEEAAAVGDPRTVVLYHPSGLEPEQERRVADALAGAVLGTCSSPVLVLEPNHDARRKIVLDALEPVVRAWPLIAHFPRPRFLALLKRLSKADPPGVLVGNSSAGLIEAAALGLAVVNVGPRQGGRERPGNVIDVPLAKSRMGDRISDALTEALQRGAKGKAHPYGDGRAGPRIAGLLFKVDPRDPSVLRKRNSY